MNHTAMKIIGTTIGMLSIVALTQGAAVLAVNTSPADAQERNLTESTVDLRYLTSSTGGTPSGDHGQRLITTTNERIAQEFRVGQGGPTPSPRRGRPGSAQVLHLEDRGRTDLDRQARQRPGGRQNIQLTGNAEGAICTSNGPARTSTHMHRYARWSTRLTTPWPDDLPRPRLRLQGVWAGELLRRVQPEGRQQQR